ncbi:MAG: DUF2182 domain-containing protein [Thermomicrobium sp.]|nr:DUF2182 domain-containing protein [Thermomicrobium sp.]MDW8006746.1 DUF2182 domain-containing protein [Thermomicrobium sp.]
MRWIVLGLLLGIATASWIVLWAWGSRAGSMMEGPSMGLGAIGFLTAWGVMMVAMMFPTAAPMVLMFARVQAGKRRQGQAFVATWVFVAGYLILWIAFGLPVYGLAVAIEHIVNEVGIATTSLARAGGLLILLAGLYQLSPLKRACLTHCRSPLHFVLTHWRDGALGALAMGTRHGVYCLGCCWLLFLILLPIGFMNIAAMVLLTALIFAEKALPFSRPVRVAAAGLLAMWGTLVLFAPHLLPVTMGMEH